jgi:flagellar motor switch/type III secretory pathway protein FliN
MATTQSLPVPAGAASGAAAGTATLERAPETAENRGGQQGLVAVAPEAPAGSVLALTPLVAQLPVELEVSVPVRDFRVRNLLALEPGKVIASQWGNGEDLPLSAGPIQLAWAEFEVIDSELAVRVTRLA